MCITSDKNPSCRRWESKCHAVSSALDQHIELSHTSLQLWTLPSQLTGHPSKNTFLCLLTGSVWKSQLVSYQKAILNVPPMSPAAIVMAISNHIHSFIRSSIHSFVCLIQAIIMNVISQECFEGFSSNFAQMSTVTD